MFGIVWACLGFKSALHDMDVLPDLRLKWKAWQQHQLLLFVFMTCASPLAKASHAVGKLALVFE